MTLDLGYRNGGIGKKLSNFCPYAFDLDDVRCGSIEGFLQSLKRQDTEEQEQIAALAKYTAYKIGQEGNGWKKTQYLYWRGNAIPRLSKEYHDLLDRAYDACYEQNQKFKQALFDSGIQALTHITGFHDPTQTTLTEWEYIYQMYRLRTKAHEEL